MDNNKNTESLEVPTIQQDSDGDTSENAQYQYPNTPAPSMGYYYPAGNQQDAGLFNEEDYHHHYYAAPQAAPQAAEYLPGLYPPMYAQNDLTSPTAGYNSSSFGPGQQYAGGYAPNAYHPHTAAGYAFAPSVSITVPALDPALFVAGLASAVSTPPPTVAPDSVLSATASDQAAPPMSFTPNATGTVVTAAPAKRKRNNKMNTTVATNISAGPKQKGKRVKTSAAALSKTQLAASGTEPAVDGTGSSEETFTLAPYGPKRRRNGRLISARPAHWVNGVLTFIDNNQPATVSAPVAVSASVAASAPVTATGPDSVAVPVVTTVPVSAIVPVLAAVPLPAVAPALVVAPGSAVATVLAVSPVSAVTPIIIVTPVSADVGPGSVLAPAPAPTALMHPAQLGVDVYGPPVHTGPEDPDFDVKPAPCGTEFPTQKACLDLCKLPTDGSVKWNELEPADVLRAVRRFRLRFPRVCWEQAEDYIFEKFGKIGSEGTRGGKIRENRKADAKGLPAPHKIRQWNMAKKSKAASAPAGDAMNLESVVSVDAEATTSVDQGNYFATGALAPTADGNLFFGSDMDLDDDEEVVADDHDVRIQAAIEEMQADRADVPPPPTPTVAPEGYDSATPTSDYSAFLHFFAQNQAHYRNDVDAALVAFATRYEVNVSMPAIPAIFDAPAAPVALGVISTTGTQFISNLEAPAVAFANREHAAGAASGVPKAWSDNDEANLERFPGSEPKDL